MSFGLPPLPVPGAIESETPDVLRQAARFILRLRSQSMSSLWKAVLMLAAACCFTGCEAVRDMATTNLPHSHSGRASILVSLRAQRAYLYRGKEVVSEASISTGREGYATPAGNFRVIRK